MSSAAGRYRPTMDAHNLALEQNRYYEASMLRSVFELRVTVVGVAFDRAMSLISEIPRYEFCKCPA
jgi:hypothetical protein